jgi:hypothetical protein
MADIFCLLNLAAVVVVVVVVVVVLLLLLFLLWLLWFGRESSQMHAQPHLNKKPVWGSRARVINIEGYFVSI